MNQSLKLFTCLLILIFASLGTWQLYRKAEKEELLASLDQSKTQVAQEMSKVLSPKQFQPLWAKGHFLPGKTLFLQSKTHQGKSGVYVLDIFETDEGQYLLVQRGWAEAEKTSSLTDPIMFEGFVRYPSPQGFFQPNNGPKTYFWIDLTGIAKEVNLPLLPFYLVAKDSFDASILPTDPIPLPRNHHLTYAITWYLLALLLLIMLLYSRNKFHKDL